MNRTTMYGVEFIGFEQAELEEFEKILKENSKTKVEITAFYALCPFDHAMIGSTAPLTAAPFISYFVNNGTGTIEEANKMRGIYFSNSSCGKKDGGLYLSEVVATTDAKKWVAGKLKELFPDEKFKDLDLSWDWWNDECDEEDYLEKMDRQGDLILDHGIHRVLVKPKFNAYDLQTGIAKPTEAEAITFVNGFGEQPIQTITDPEIIRQFSFKRMYQPTKRQRIYLYRDDRTIIVKRGTLDKEGLEGLLR